MTAGERSRSARIGLVVVVLAVLLRSIPVLYWGDIQFDADQAVIGLMAKHVAEGRAFPVFQYGLRYVLVMESWLAAPFVALAAGSIPLVKIVPVLLNAATAGTLYAIATSTLAIGPVTALLVVAPVVLPGPTTARDLTDALGMNIEPLFFTVLLWLLRERPIALGIVAALAVKNREFALYAIAALLIVDVLRDRTAAFWRGRLVALVAFALAWSAVEVLRTFESPLGPGTTFAMTTEAGGNMSVATSAMCIVPAQIPADLWQTASEFLPWQFGLLTDPRSTAAVYGVQPLSALWLWPLLAAALAAGVAAGIARAWRRGPTQATWLGLYLVGVGVQSVLVYATTRCGHVSPHTARYTLLSLLVPVGALLLAVERGEPRSALRVGLVAVATAWIGVCALGVGTEVYALVKADPHGSYSGLARYLDRQGVQYIVSDYLTGYNVAFLTGERIKARTNFERVRDYTLAVDANRDRAVLIRRANEEPCAGGVLVSGFYVCPPNPSQR